MAWNRAIAAATVALEKAEARHEAMFVEIEREKLDEGLRQARMPRHPWPV